MDLIRKFNEYISIVQESLDSPEIVSWRVNDDSSLIGYFEIDNIIYKIESYKQIGNNWTYSFSSLENNKWCFELKAVGNIAFRILATIKSNLYFLYEQKKPNSIIFSAIDSNDTRKRLYSYFCERFCNEKGLTLSNRGNGDYILYLIFNNNLDLVDKDDIFKSVQKVIEKGK